MTNYHVELETLIGDAPTLIVPKGTQPDFARQLGFNGTPEVSEAVALGIMDELEITTQDFYDRPDPLTGRPRKFNRRPTLNDIERSIQRFYPDFSFDAETDDAGEGN